MKDILKKSRAYLDMGAGRLAKKTLNKVCHVQFWRYQSYLYREGKKKSPALTGSSPDFPLISIVVPLYRTKPAYLRALIKSVIASGYTRWELCLADGSADEKASAAIKTVIRRFGDKRIRYRKLKKNLGISGNTNAAICMTRGSWIAFCDHDDELTADACGMVAYTILNNPDAGLIYSDEDKIGPRGGYGFDPHFKPDFDPVLLTSANYISHLTVIRRDLLKKIGPLDSDYDGAQDYELVLRACLCAESVVHIPKVLYHWRVTGGSTAKNPDEKDYAFESGKRALESYFKHLNISQPDIMPGFSNGNYRLRFDASKAEMTILVWTTGDVFAIQERAKEVFLAFQGRYPVKAVSCADLFSEAGSLNTDYVMFLSADAEISCEDADLLLGYVAGGLVNACAPTLTDRNGVVLSSGQFVCGGHSYDAFCGIPFFDPGYMGRAKMTRCVSSLRPDCLVVSRRSIPDFKKAAVAPFAQAVILSGSVSKCPPVKIGQGADRFYHPAFIKRSPGFIVDAHGFSGKPDERKPQ